jgi:glycine cleavage system transcriptional repressor
MGAQLMAVTVIGKDRPGIVASVTKVLFEAGCNLEDATSTILRGHFAMMLVVNVPGESDQEDLEQNLNEAADRDLVVTVRPVEDVHGTIQVPTHMVSVYGADRPGIVYRIAEILASSGANITDLTSRVIGSENEPVYAVMLEVATEDVRAIENGLMSLREELGVEISVHPIEPDLL